MSPLRNVLDMPDFAPSTLSEGIRWAEQIEECWADEVEALEAQYYELILAVVMKHEGETRHETALRYIVERETMETSGSVAQVENRTDILKHNYEKLGLSSALVVNNKYGKHSAFGYMREE